jgi:predicted nucleotidyltransferase
MTTGINWLPEPFRPLAEAAMTAAQADPRIVGLALGGSAASGEMDEFSDLDFVIIADNDRHSALLREAPAFAASLGPLLSAFTGEHVREPRLLLCLYGAPTLRVDFTFVAEREIDRRIEDWRILWQRDRALDAALLKSPAVSSRVDPQWLEDRFWIWLYNGVAKAGRGELFACLEQLAFLRRTVLGPLIAQQRGRRPDGVRRIERTAPDLAPALAATIGDHTALGCARALRATVELYRRIREESLITARNTAAETAVVAYLANIEGVPGVRPQATQ